jgi:[ribosomal protein S5]-alanine N-acetyltransferase
MLEQIDLDYQRGETVHWGIEIAGGIAGTCGFYRGFAAATGEVGYVLKADFRGLGIMTAAMRPVLAFGFEHIGLRTINAFTDHDNLASQAVLTRLGFRLEADSPVAETLHFVLSAADAPRTAR